MENIISIVIGVLLILFMNVYKRKFKAFVRRKMFLLVLLLVLVLSISYKFYDEREKTKQKHELDRLAKLQEEERKIALKRQEEETKKRNFFEKEIIALAKKGDIEAIFELVDSYNSRYANSGGWLFVPDEALHWLKEATQNGSIKAMLFLGEYYQHLAIARKKPINDNKKQAIYWYTLAAENGHRKAQRVLAQIYKNMSSKEQYDLFKHEWGFDKAIETQKDIEEAEQRTRIAINKAIYWYEQAAKNGDAYSTYELYLIYVDGLWSKGFPKNYKIALNWLLLLRRQMGRNLHLSLNKN